jgi:hypothetical protein
LSDNAKKTKHAPETGKLTSASRHLGDDVSGNEQPTPMLHTRIRPLAARQLTLLLWFFTTPLATC